MPQEIKAPVFPESVQDGTIATWHKQAGEQVSRDELIVDIETDKVVLEVNAVCDGVLSEILKPEGSVVLSSELIGLIEVGAVVAAAPTKSPTDEATSSNTQVLDELFLSPAARKLVMEHELDPSTIAGTGKNGLISKEDVMQALELKGKEPASALNVATVSVVTPASVKQAAPQEVSLDMPVGPRVEKRVPMTRLRQMVAKRLVEAQQNAAMLTTFNEVNMKPIMALRNQFKDDFEKRHDTKLGFMSFFVKAVVEALKRYPAVNASIDGADMVYHGYQDIGVAVSSPRGLVVPVLRNAENLNMAEIEQKIKSYGIQARDGKLGIEDMQGGTFTISNGGVFGSLLSTPILNPPQTAILGMHKIQDRPMAVNGEVVILPMMYLALSYDHRMIDGKEAVSFLVTIKELLEEPARLLLEI